MLIYKIAHADEWLAAERAGVYHGSEKDRADGFLHFSTAAQLRETLERHYADTKDLLVIAAVDSEALGDALTWEPSRGGELFPHLYGALPMATRVRTYSTDLQSLTQSNFTGLQTFISGES